MEEKTKLLKSLINEEIDIARSIGGSLGASLGATLASNVGSHIAASKSKNPQEEEKIRKWANIAGYGGALGTALAGSHYASTPGFIGGATLGGLGGSLAGGYLAKHLNRKK